MTQVQTETHEPVEFETIACPLCSEHKFTGYLSGRDLRYGGPGKFRIVKCVNCRHLYTNPCPTLNAMREYYPAEYAPHRLIQPSQTSRATTHKRSTFKQKLRQVPGLQRFVHWLTDSRAEYIPPVSELPKRALEVGCADGRFLQHLVEADWNVQGIEISAGAARAARQRGLEVHVGTLESADLDDDSFDAVFAWMVIEHLHDPLGTLKEIRRLLKPAGWFVFSVPNAGCWESRVFGRYWHAYDLPRHLQHFTTKTIRQLLETSGFETSRIIHQRNMYNITGSLGLLFRDNFPKRLGAMLLRFTDSPSIHGILMLTPFARLLAWIRQAGMLTVVARPSRSKPAGNHEGR